jgi:tRNA-specific 2-thiouridylase
MKIAVAMSGGIDSSVAAALLKAEGYDVFGVTMQLTDDKNSQEAIENARQAAQKLEIPHHVINLKNDFKKVIIDSFCKEYCSGNTPNPCVLCNRYMKFGILREKAEKLGAEFFATGHYARVEKQNNGKFLLKKGKDKTKDQSYFLCRLTQEQLGRTLFPIGNFTKVKVKKIAQEMGLPALTRPESQEICFVTDNDHAAFSKENIKTKIKPGPILDQLGKVLGQHQGIIFYTVGQRKGLGVSSATPLYITAIDPDRNAIIVGTQEQTFSDELVADNLNWISINPPQKPLKIKARIRYRHAEADATVSTLDKTNVYVRFKKPQMAITPGQAVVFYDGDKVVGGGRITRQGR